MKSVVLLVLFLLISLSLIGQPSSLPHITGRFLYWNNLSDSDIVAFLDEMQQYQMTTVYTVATRTKVVPNPKDCTKAYWDWLFLGSPENIGTLLTESSKRGIKVYIGLLNDPGICLNYEDEANQAGSTVQYILQRWGQESSLAGWVTGEPYLLGDESWYQGVTQDSINYLKPIVKEIRKYSSLTVATSPYLVSWSNEFQAVAATPQLAGITAKKVMDETGIGLYLYQDYMGSRGSSNISNLGIVGKYGIRDYFTAISSSIGPSRLVLVHEIWSTRNASSTSISRFNQQMNSIPDYLISGRVTWLDQEYMTDVGPWKQEGSSRLLDSYKATRGFGGKYFTPLVYWWTPTDPQHPDYGPQTNTICKTYYGSSKLINNIVGDPFNTDGQEWVGTEAGQGAALCIDLGSPQTIDWISLHTAQQTTKGVTFPQSVTIYGKNDGDQWYIIHQDQTNMTTSLFLPPDTIRNPDLLPGDGERLIGNITPLKVRFRYFWIYAYNKGKTRLTELEVVGQ